MSDNGTSMMDVKDVLERDRKLGFERLDLLEGATFSDTSTLIITPLRSEQGKEEKIHRKVVESWERLIGPMNGRRAKFYPVGHEVGHAYNEMIKVIIGHPVLSKYKYVLSAESDNVPPADGHLKLIETINMKAGPFDAVGGLYFTKGALNMPMAYGNPKSLVDSGTIDFRPRDVCEALKTGNVMEVNGLGMGFTLWRMDLFREFSPPWFVTLQEVIPSMGLACMTQDLYFCERLRRAGKRLAVDLRVAVGHIDTETGEMY